MNNRAIMASTLGMDYSELPEYRYQPTRYSSPAVYCCGNNYYAISYKKPKHKVGGEWEMHIDQLWAKHHNTVAWVCKDEDAND